MQALKNIGEKEVIQVQRQSGHLSLLEKLMVQPVKVILVSVLLACMAWLFDAWMHYLFFNSGNQPYFRILLNPPMQIWYARIFLLCIFVIFGLLFHVLFRRRKRIEDELDENKENLRATLSSIGDAVISTDLQGSVVRMNRVASELTHWNPKEAIGKPLSEVFRIVNAKTRIIEENPVKKVLAAGKTVSLTNDTLLIAKNGTEYQIADSAAPIFDRKSNITGVVLVFRDVTEDYVKSKKIEESEEFLKAVFHSIQDGISVLNKDLTIRYINPVMEKWYAHNMPLVGKKCFECYHQSDKPCAACPTIRSIKTGKAEMEIVPGSPDPESPVKWLELFSYPLIDVNTGETTGVIEFVRDITKRRMAEEELQESRQRLQLALQGADLGLWDWNIQTGAVNFNERWAEMLGYQLEEIEPNVKSWEKLLHPDDLAYVMTNLQSHLDGKTPIYQTEHRVRTKDGKWKWIYDSGKVVEWDADGNPLRAVGTHLDIDYRKKAEEELRKNEERLNHAQKIAKMGNITLDVDSGEVTWSEGIYDMLKYDLSEEITLDKVNAEIHHPDDLESINQWVHDSVASGKDTLTPFEYRLIRKDGATIYVKTEGEIQRKANESPRIFVTVKDITETKEAEKAVKESEEKYRLLAETTSDIIVLHDLNGQITYANRAFQETIGRKTEEIIGKSILSFISEKYFDKAFERQSKRIANDAQTYRYETEIENKQGKTIPVDVSSSPVIREGKIEEILIVARDITERKRAEHELKTKNEEYLATNEELSESLERIQEMNMKLEQAKAKAEESDRLKSAFLANMSHEIRTPMNGILGFAQLLKTHALAANKQGEYIDIILESGKRMLNLINDLIDISKIEAGQMQISYTETDINEVLEYCYTFFQPEAAGKGILVTYSKSLPNQEATIETDREKLIAILTNLIKNALKFTEQGVIEYGYVTEGRNKLKFYVKDTGIGIPKDRQDAIFERFVHADLSMTKPYEGAGLGLSITKAYVEMLGGKIWLKSAYNKGSQFYFTLPYNGNASTSSNNNPTSSGKSGYSPLKDLIVLIAEDDKSGSIYLTELLKKKCKKILHAYSGSEAVDICRQNENIQLILMDIKMPEMDGYQVTREIRTFNEKVVIVAQTAYAMSGDREEAMKAGCNDYISKPVKSEDLMRIIEKYF